MSDGQGGGDIARTFNAAGAAKKRVYAALEGMRAKKFLDASPQPKLQPQDLEDDTFI